MSDPEQRAARRVDRLVARLLGGKASRVTPGDASERDAILAAASLTGARAGHPRMSPAFRRKLGRQLRQEPRSNGLSRRSLLTGGAGLALGALGGGIAGAVYSTVTDTTPGHAPAPISPDARATIEPGPGLGRWADTGLTLEGLREGVPQRVDAGAIGAFVVRRGGRVQVMSAVCTHVACELQWRQQAGDLLCPCHGRSFTLDGLSQDDRSYPLPPLPLVRFRVRNGRIEVLGT
jgi:nitrite reductase/ring-hydroxylating ferredoxin subunit